MYPRITRVEHLDDYRLKLTFTSGESGVLDLADLIICSTGSLIPLQEVRYFAQVKLDPGSGNPVWPNGVALNPAALYERTMRTQVDWTLSLFAADPAVQHQQRILEAEQEFAKMRRVAMQAFDICDGEVANTLEEMFAQLHVEC
jgi:hypothetical protein